jgi:hypothetical protein
MKTYSELERNVLGAKARSVMILASLALIVQPSPTTKAATNETRGNPVEIEIKADAVKSHALIGKYLPGYTLKTNLARIDGKDSSVEILVTPTFVGSPDSQENALGKGPLELTVKDGLLTGIEQQDLFVSRMLKSNLLKPAK